MYDEDGPMERDTTNIARKLAADDRAVKSIQSAKLAGTKAVDTTATPITAEIQSTANWLDELSAAIAQLEATIEPILAGGYPQEDYNNEPSGESTVYKLQQATNKRLRNMTEWVHQIEKRVEL